MTRARRHIEIRRGLWRGLLDAHLNCKYWHAMTRTYSDRELYARVFLAITASSAVAGWGFWEDVEWAWKLLSGASALLAVALPLLNLPKKIQMMSALAGNWSILLADYEALWMEYNSGLIEPEGALEVLKNLRHREAEDNADEAGLPFSSRIRDLCFAEVLNVRGVSSQTK